jgi:hypothetical protein
VPPPGSAAGGAVGAGGGGGEVGGFGIQTHVYGVDMPSPRSSYRPVENCTTFGVGLEVTGALYTGGS